jgi:hypothetical protein
LLVVTLAGCAVAPPPAPRTVEHVVIVTPPPVPPPPPRAAHTRPFHRHAVACAPPPHRHEPAPHGHVWKPPRRSGHAFDHGPARADHGDKDRRRPGSHGGRHDRRAKPKLAPEAQRSKADDENGRAPLGRRRM